MANWAQIVRQFSSHHHRRQTRRERGYLPSLYRVSEGKDVKKMMSYGTKRPWPWPLVLMLLFPVDDGLSGCCVVVGTSQAGLTRVIIMSIPTEVVPIRLNSVILLPLPNSSVGGVKIEEGSWKIVQRLLWKLRDFQALSENLFVYVNANWHIHPRWDPSSGVLRLFGHCRWQWSMEMSGIFALVEF